MARNLTKTMTLMMPFDYETLAFELDNWARNKGVYSQIGVNVCVYRLGN